MSAALTDARIFAAVEGRFPELLEDLTIYGWLWVKAALEVAAVDGDEALADFTLALAEDYRQLQEVPTHLERMRFALAARISDLQVVKLCLVLARDADNLPGSLTGWRLAGKPAGRWQTWDHARHLLSDRHCQVRGKFPGEFLVCRFVDRVEERFHSLVGQAGLAS